jgi:hypothetical protein
MTDENEALETELRAALRPAHRADRMIFTATVLGRLPRRRPYLLRWALLCGGAIVAALLALVLLGEGWVDMFTGGKVAGPTIGWAVPFELLVLAAVVAWGAAGATRID